MFVLVTDKGRIDSEWSLLDSESTVSTFVNRELLNNFRTGKDQLVTITSSGIARTRTIAYLKGYDDVWYDENQ